MQKSEIRKLNRNARLVKKVELLVSQLPENEKRSVSFFAGLATYLADGLLDSQLPIARGMDL